MTEQLKPCPFCGGQPEGCDFDGRGNYISCPSCGIDGPDGGGYCGGRSGAIKAWNTRALTTSQPAQAGEVEEREAFCIYPKCLTTGRVCAGDCSKVPTQPAAQATPEPSRGMIGMGAQALGLELASAICRDEGEPSSYDEAAGKFGPHVSEWLRKVATEYLSKPATPPQQAAGEPVGEPAHIEVVGEIVATDDGNDVRWSIEGGADAIPEGMVLLIADRQITDDKGSGEVYTHPAPAVPEDVLAVLQAIHRRPSDAGIWLDDLTHIIRAAAQAKGGA